MLSTMRFSCACVRACESNKGTCYRTKESHVSTEHSHYRKSRMDSVKSPSIVPRPQTRHADYHLTVLSVAVSNPSSVTQHAYRRRKDEWPGTDTEVRIVQCNRRESIALNGQAVNELLTLDYIIIGRSIIRLVRAVAIH